ncbi:MAG: hypothetical protein IKY59_07370 [Oscillospiraceae bacterium]|nr:hypothetical protein [Oscillospiraceae bacterium]
MAEFATNGKANTGVALGAVGTGLGALNAMGGTGILGGLFGGGGCGNNAYINRYEQEQQARISELETEVKLRDANIYSDQKSLELYKYFDGEIKDIRNTLAAQAVHNEHTAGAFNLVKSDLSATRNELYCAINRERDERCCGDNAIVSYANATFYPKLVADVTVGTTTTAQTVYNPLPNCGCCK